jgi:hypothetical protein
MSLMKGPWTFHYRQLGHSLFIEERLELHTLLTRYMIVLRRLEGVCMQMYCYPKFVLRTCIPYPQQKFEQVGTASTKSPK